MRSLSVVAFICLFALIPGISQVQAKTYILGVEDLNYLPYYANEKNEYYGFARDFFDLFAKNQGISFDYKVLPVKRLWNDFLNEKLDFKFPDHPHWNNEAKKGIRIVYSEAVVQYIDGVMVTSANHGITVEDLKKLGTVAGFTAWDYLDLIKAQQIKIVENSSFVGLLKQTIVGRLDGAYINVSVAQHQLETKLKQPQALVFADQLPHTKAAYLVSSIKHPELVAALNAFIKGHGDAIRRLKVKYRVEGIQTPTN